MTDFEVPHRRTFLAMASFLVIVVAGCAPAESGRLQGYVDGEFVYVASALPGELKSLPVQRGAQVNAGAPLFRISHQSCSFLIELPLQIFRVGGNPDRSVILLCP